MIKLKIRYADNQTEYLYFPCEEEAIDKAFARLGTTADEVKITLEDFNTDSPEWFRRFREIAAEEGVYELNKLIAVVNIADMNLKKLWSVAEYAEAEDAEQLVRLARNIGCFTFIEGATSYAEVGEFVTKHNGDFVVNPTVAKSSRCSSGSMLPRICLLQTAHLSRRTAGSKLQTATKTAASHSRQISM